MARQALHFSESCMHCLLLALLATFINISSFIIINNLKRLSSNFRSFILAFTDLKVMLLVPLHVS